MTRLSSQLAYLRRAAHGCYLRGYPGVDPGIQERLRWVDGCRVHRLAQNCTSLSLGVKVCVAEVPIGVCLAQLTLLRRKREMTPARGEPLGHGSEPSRLSAF